MLTSQILSNGHVSRQAGPRAIAAFGHLGAFSVPTTGVPAADPAPSGQTPRPPPSRLLQHPPSVPPPPPPPLLPLPGRPAQLPLGHASRAVRPHLPAPVGPLEQPLQPRGSPSPQPPLASSLLHPAQPRRFVLSHWGVSSPAPVDPVCAAPCTPDPGGGPGAQNPRNDCKSSHARRNRAYCQESPV